MAQSNYSESVSEHYGRKDLGQAILDAIRASGKDPDNLNYAELSSFDQLHSRGKEATIELATLAQLSSGNRVLDVGGGIGGSARILASEFGCVVTVLDLTKEFCKAGEVLTLRTGLSELVSFRNANALEMPFPDESFDVVWTQHSTMNITDKKRLYSEIRRVLRPRGKLVMHEIYAGPIQPIYYPVPWASSSDISFLIRPEHIRELLSKDYQFKELAWLDDSRRSLESFVARTSELPSSGARPAPGFEVIFGSDFKAAVQNLVLNLKENRVFVIQALFERN